MCRPLCVCVHLCERAMLHKDHVLLGLASVLIKKKKQYVIFEGIFLGAGVNIQSRKTDGSLILWGYLFFAGLFCRLGLLVLLFLLNDHCYPNEQFLSRWVLSILRLLRLHQGIKMMYIICFGLHKVSPDLNPIKQQWQILERHITQSSHHHNQTTNLANIFWKKDVHRYRTDPGSCRICAKNLFWRFVVGVYGRMTLKSLITLCVQNVCSLWLFRLIIWGFNGGDKH